MKLRAFLDFHHSTKFPIADKQKRDERIFNAGWDGALKSKEHLFKHFTCHTCPSQETCEWAWDMYNTNGDCLADK